MPLRRSRLRMSIVRVGSGRAALSVTSRQKWFAGIPAWLSLSCTRSGNFKSWRFLPEMFGNDPIGEGIDYLDPLFGQRNESIRGQPPKDLVVPTHQPFEPLDRVLLTPDDRLVNHHE